MNYEIIDIFSGMAVVDTIEAKDKNDALNKFAEKNGLAKNELPDSRWFALRHTYLAAESGVNARAKEWSRRFNEECLKHVHTPETVGELKASMKDYGNE